MPGAYHRPPTPVEEGTVTVPLDVATTYFLGHVFVLSARRRLEGEDRFATFPTPFLQAMGYALFVFLPVTGSFYFRHTDWSLAYLLAPDRVPDWFGAAALALYATGMWSGYLVAQVLVQRGHLRVALASALAALLANLAIFLATRDQYLHLGTYAEYHAGTARPLFESGAFLDELNIGGAILALPVLALAGWNLLRDRRSSSN